MLAHLRQQGEETIARLWQEAEAKVREQRAAAEQSVTRQREEAAASFAARLDQLTRLAVLAAKRQAANRRLAGHQELAARLQALAFSNLAALRSAEYPQTFALLVAELPAHPWRAATVHPDDRELAKALLPEATIATDPEITGGLVVSGENGKVRINNTFSKRLERAWPELLPQLLAELLKEVEDDHPAPG